jgi:protein-tyrosine-phosphatase
MAEKGIDITAQRIKLATPQMMEQVEQIVVLCDPKFCPSWILQSSKTKLCVVPDPFEKNLNIVRQTRDQIETIVKGLL